MEFKFSKIYQTYQADKHFFLLLKDTGHHKIWLTFINLGNFQIHRKFEKFSNQYMPNKLFWNSKFQKFTKNIKQINQIFMLLQNTEHHKIWLLFLHFLELKILYFETFISEFGKFCRFCEKKKPELCDVFRCTILSSKLLIHTKTYQISCSSNLH